MKFFQIMLLVGLWLMSSVVLANNAKIASSLTSSAAVASASNLNLHPLNLNTATKKELITVPGLNPSKVRAIMAWRKKHGPFTTLDSLRQVSGFKRMNDENFKNIEAKLSVS